MDIDRIVQEIREGGEDANEAALTLGLLIEQEKVHRPAPGDDGGVREILGDELANYRLTREELEAAIDQLVDYIDETPEPEAMAVWALTKSHDPRTVPHLIALLDRVIDEPEKEHLAYQALIGITSFDDEQAVSAVRRAAERGHGDVKETATQYLRLHASPDNASQ
jgi:hypothetical protein